MTTPTPRIPSSPIARAVTRASGPARDARLRDASARARAPGQAPTCARRLALARGPAIATVLWGALVLGVDARQAHAPRAHKAASAPSTEQILAPSAAMVPDALPPDRQVWRCGSSYSARPCSGADEKPLAIADPRSDAQRLQSQDLAARDRRLAAWYEAGRRQRETPASAPVPTRAPAASAACVDTTMMHCVPKKPRSRRANAPTHAAMPGRGS